MTTISLQGIGEPVAVCERLAGDVGRVLATAFQDEPVTGWLVPDARERAELMPVFFSWLALEVFLNDWWVVCLTADGTPDGVLVAVALWLDHTAEVRPTVGSGADPEGPLRALGAEPGRVTALVRAMTGAHPRAEHEYLMFAGVHPAYQGKGLGSRLLRQRHELWDACGTAAYLEATSDRNRALYARHGYRDHGEAIRLPGGPTLFPMWRHPEAPREQSSAAGLVEGARRR